jgi:2-hydroxy-3-keto-5-methylthiopentenyl-1-phosphate phosphatase
MAVRKKPRIAIAYDFDGTLSPDNMQEYNFFPELKISPNKFWGEAKQIAKDNNADEILAYMTLMLEKAFISNTVKVTEDAFFKYGQNIKLFDGVDTWFDRINSHATGKEIIPEHYIISSGIREMILGSSISHNFTEIFASKFRYDKYGVAKWPAMAINYTTKTQFLFRISKGALDVWDHIAVNKYVSHNELEVPFENMIYIGDGATDIPCFRVVKSKGGHSIAVYKPKSSRKKAIADSLVKYNRVDQAFPADYSEGSKLESYIKKIINKISLRYQK